MTAPTMPDAAQVAADSADDSDLVDESGAFLVDVPEPPKDDAETERLCAAFDLVDAWNEAHAHRPTRAPARLTRVPDLNAPRPKWLIKNVLQEKSLAAIYGKWGTGKTTLAVELGVAIARGLPWHGSKTRRGTVVYIASESPSGVRSRLDAILRDQGTRIEELEGRFLEVTARPNLLLVADITPLIDELKTLGPISLIVFDTFAMATVGSEENSTTHIGLAVENAKRMQDKTGACVLFVHHSGKDESRGMRGSSSLPAAVDTEIALSRPDEGGKEDVKTASIGKQRDGEDYRELFHYKLSKVELGRDEDGVAITSVVVREVAKADKPVAAVELTKVPVRRLVLKTLGDAQRAMTGNELILTVAAQLSNSGPGQDRRRQRVRQAIDGMVADGQLHLVGGLYTPVIPGVPFAPVVADSVPQSNGDLC